MSPGQDEHVHVDMYALNLFRATLMNTGEH